MKKVKYFFAVVIAVVLMAVPVFAADDCPHSNYFVLYDGSDHYALCSLCFELIYMDSSHDEHCDFALFERDISFYGYSECDSFRRFLLDEANFDPSSVRLYYDETQHYVKCMECRRVIPCVFLDNQLGLPHSDDNCMVCGYISQIGISVGGVLEYESPNFSAVSALVTAAISWLSAFALCIVSNPLLLIFVCCAFVGLGVGLLKRIRHL